MKYLYKYPQRAFPYADLVAENRRRSRLDPEYELLDTGIFDEDRYFDVFVEYAKGAPDDILIRISAVNRGPDTATLHLLPTLWFKNDWSWYPANVKPKIAVARSGEEGQVLEATHCELERYCLYAEAAEELLFTENESNMERLFGVPERPRFVRDGIDACVVHGRREAVNPEPVGTKAAPHYIRAIGAGETAVVRLRLCNQDLRLPLGREFETTLELRKQEADAFYETVTPFELPEDMRNVQRQAFAGMLWNKQYYRYMVSHWLDGDPAGPPPPEQRKRGRNPNGGTSPRATSCRCRTSGNIHGSPRGTWRSIASRSR
jgi:hypothetical protein